MTPKSQFRYFEKLAGNIWLLVQMKISKTSLKVLTDGILDECGRSVL